MMKVFIAGLTGTGKSSVAQHVAKKLGLEYLPSSMLFREFAGKDTKTKGWWEKEGLEFIKERLLTDIDEQFDKYLLELATEKDNFVIDSWTLPWLYKGEALRIYLTAPFEVRVQRVMERDQISYSEAKIAVHNKDLYTRKVYLTKYGFDINKDWSVFDFVLNTKYFKLDEIKKLVFNIVKQYRQYMG